MSQIDISISELRSRRMRSRIVGQENTVRVMEPPEDDNALLPEFLKNAFGGIWQAIVNFRGWIIGSLGRRLHFSFSGLWSFLVSTTTFLYTFNWNASDKELNKQVEAIKNLIAAQLGGTLGNLVGYLACGIIPAAGIFTFNEALGLYLLKEVGEEAFDEFLDNLGLLIFTMAQGAARAFIIGTYKNIRRGLKTYFKNPNSAQSKFMQRLFGSGFNNAVKTWGAEGAKPWSFSLAIEERIDDIKDPALQNFVEEFYEETIDACVEAGYVIAGGLDSWILQQRQMRTSILGKERVVEILPNRKVEDEIIIMAGPEQILKPDLVQLMAGNQQIVNRDIGQFVGEPLRENIIANPLTISVKITFFDNRTPPFWTKRGDNFVVASYTIPDIDRTKLDWERIKQACGGRNGYMWGRFVAHTHLDNQRRMAVHGATPDEAEDRLIQLLTLSTAEILTLNTTEEKKKAQRAKYKALYKESTRIYPAYFTIINRQKILNEESGITTSTGTYKQRSDRIDLWVDKEPFNYQEKINELLRIPGTND